MRAEMRRSMQALSSSDPSTIHKIFCSLTLMLPTQTLRVRLLEAQDEHSSYRNGSMAGVV